MPRRGIHSKLQMFLRGSREGVVQGRCFDIDEARKDVGRGAFRVRIALQACAMDGHARSPRPQGGRRRSEGAEEEEKERRG